MEVTSSSDEMSLSRSAKILMGATSPFWVPVGIVSLVIGMPVLGALLVKNAVADNKKLKQYENEPRDYFLQRCEKFIDSLTEEKVSMYAQWLLEKTTATLQAYKKAIPTRIQADRALMSQLSNENRSREDVVLKYDPVINRSRTLQRKMLQLGFELCPARVDERHLKWEQTTESVVRDEEFSISYRGELKNCGRVENHDSNHPLQVAVKVFKHKFDDDNLRFYLDEESRIRYVLMTKTIKRIIYKAVQATK